MHESMQGLTVLNFERVEIQISSHTEHSVAHPQQQNAVCSHNSYKSHLNNDENL